MTGRKRIAVVGAGIAGLTTAYLLAGRYDVTVYESNDYAGGHTHTRPVPLGGRTWPVNTGFIVFNDWTYPNFIRLLDELGVASEASDMSFSVQSERNGLEYNGTSLNTLFAQRRNLLNPRFLGMIRQILRFNRQARRDLEKGSIAPEETLSDYLDRHGFTDYFRRHYIVPMGAAIWSAPEKLTAAFPARFFLRFFNNHGMLSVDDRPTWRVVSGGSARYVEAMCSRFADHLRLDTPVRQIRRTPDRVTLVTDQGQAHYDQVVIACHSDQALALLAEPTPEEQRLLGALPYQQNDVVLHTDSRMLPRNKLAWAAWNYHIPASPDAPVSVTYNMNILQNLPAPETFCVTLNRTADIDPNRIIDRFTYSHPLFTLEGMEAQQQYHRIGNRNRTHYCGAYWFNGFHEDGVNSALRVVRDLGVEW